MRKIILILLIGVIVIAYANIADNLGGNKLRTKPQLTSSGGMWLGNSKTPLSNLKTSAPFSMQAVPVPTKSLNNSNTDFCENEGALDLSGKLPTIPYAIEWTITLNHVACVGVTPVCVGNYPEGETLLWVASGGLTGSGDPNYILIYNLNTLTLVDSFQQATTTTWGYRDMCFYNGYVYAGTEATLHKIDPTTYTVVGTYSVSGISGNVIRALTDNNVEDSLWTANWASPIYKFWNQGGAVRTVANNSYSIYGLGLDPAHNVCWGSSQPAGTDLVKYRYPDFSVIDYCALPELEGGIAGGCEMWRDTFLLYLGQCDPNDKVFCIRLYGLGENDMRVSQLNVPSSTTPFQRFSIQALAQNIGLNTQPAGVPVKMRIIGPDGYLYEDLDQTTTRELVQGDTQRITFTPQWQAPATLGLYTIKAWTELPGDQNPNNDTVTATIEVTNWLSYCDFNNIAYYYPRLTGEKVMLIVPSEFGVVHPLTIDSLSAMFYVGSYPWQDSAFVFKIYAGDGSTLLYQSETLYAKDYPEVMTVYVNPPVVINSGNFYFGIAAKADSHPSVLSDNLPVGRSFYGSPGEKSWTVNTSGEWAFATFVSWTPRNNDVGPYAMVEPLSMVAPNVAMTPKVVIKNYGFNDQPSIPVVMEIYDQSKALVYTGTGSIALNSGDTGTVALTPQWTPGAHGTVYDITVYTALPTDENPANDTGYTFTSAFSITRNMYSNLTSTPPTIDGDIQETEWSDANQYDVSDVLGQASGYPYRAGSAYLWVKHDENFIYYAIAMPYASTANNADQIGLYLDENNDGVWATDSTEGNYWLINYEAPDIDSLIYRALFPIGFWRYGPVDGAEISANLTSGYMQFEGKIPFGTEKYQIDANPNGDTMKFWMFAVDQEPPYQDWYGWWPQDVPGDSWRYPHLYGNLILVGHILDVGVVSVDAPSGTLYQGFSYPVKATVKNYGNVPTPSFDVIFTIAQTKDGEYCDTFTVPSLGVGEQLQITFNSYLATTLGLFATHVRITLSDVNLENNEKWGDGFEVTTLTPGQWTQKEPIETAVTNAIKDGGALVGVGTDLYAFVGTKTNKFKKYTIGSGWSYTETESLPFGYKYPITDPPSINKKFPGKGAALCYDGVNTIYATRGNGTREFWSFNLTTRTWTREESIPVPKGVKGGTALAFNDGKVYLLAGAQKKTDLNNFYVFDTITRHWSASAPLSLGSYTKVWKDGSCLAVCNGQVYALKGGDKDNLFYAFDGSAWTPKETLPKPDTVFGSAKTKVLVKDGGCMASDGNVIYAVKGGATDCFWKYTPGTPGVWQMKERIPVTDKKHAPKTGAAMAYADGKIWLLVGNKKPDFWCYTPGVEKSTAVAVTNSAIMTEKTLPNLQFNLSVIPNPFTKTAHISYTVPSASKVSIKLYNATGSLIKTMVDGYKDAGIYSLSLTGLTNGVYFLKYQDANHRKEIKLIVQ
ncbi:MAG: T9SS type A sorting domain-containing protein [candidate division WOR-3 bacterium]